VADNLYLFFAAPRFAGVAALHQKPHEPLNLEDFAERRRAPAGVMACKETVHMSYIGGCGEFFTRRVNFYGGSRAQQRLCGG
jgi:hypothetical protein